MGRRTLVVATRNEHKLRELAEILAGVELEPLPEGVELPPEEGETFAANALAKARAAHAASGGAAIADDSGIEARALGGAPGVRSARFAGPDATDEQNLERLLRELDGADDRRLSYVCVLAYLDEEGRERLFEGRCDGVLASEPRGSGGFGYDPIFLLAEGMTAAELPAEEKDRRSHRGRAVEAASPRLSELLAVS
jgi:XTP/dITP diphosphohydrolase